MTVPSLGARGVHSVGTQLATRVVRPGSPIGAAKGTQS